MLIASGMECENERAAARAAPPQTIGNIETATGCGVLSRASGIAVQIRAGDPVCHGDVIETAADGEIGIRFVDGTVCNIPCGTRAMLRELVRDSGGIPQTVQFVVTGEVAKATSLDNDVSPGNIRGRSQAGGFGLLSLAALTFSMMKGAEGAEPNVAILDDDRIAYKDLEHGTFELVTKEPIPRHIIVEDPGETVVVRKSGSSVSVNPVGNNPTRMEELLAAQQDVLANYAKGQGPNGSSAPPFSAPGLLQPINFIQSDDPHATQNSLAALPTLVIPINDTPIVHLPPPPPKPPTLNALTGPTEVDTSVFDDFTATSGTFTASSTTGGALTFGISGGTAGNTVLDGASFDVSQAGPFGTLFLNSASGAYTFVPNNNAINALQAPTTESFTITVSEGSLSADQTFTIAINGSNDAAHISGTTAGAAIEAGGAANGVHGLPTVSGTLTDTDVDNPPNTFTAVSTPTASLGGYGTFTITAAGVWTYSLNNANTAVQALNVGDKLTDSFTVTTIDGTPQVVTITIDGTNDAAIISGTTTGSVTESSCEKHGNATATGTLTDTDVDNPSNTFTAVCTPTPSTGGYGTFTITAAGAWTYALNNANSAVQALNVGDKLIDSFTVTTIDGTAQVVTITIDGTNDAAIISGTTTGCVTEPSCEKDGKPTATGTLTDTDVDNPPDTFTAVSTPTPSRGGYGTFTMTAAGVWTYMLDTNNCAVKALDDDDTLTDSFTVTTIDGTKQVVTITIHGAEDENRDFDHHRDTGPHATSNAPTIQETPKQGTAAGTGDSGQIIHASAGVDTVSGTKGNDADDTIHVGAGRDTVNGNKGDAVAGGHWAHSLAGDGGGDHFVYLSTDQGTTRFGTISDFKSKSSERIDLTALGAAAFVILALDATSTAVPAHTIAWIYDSSANQTIVYVNPTDHILKIGDSGLQEIHLQGFATIEPSDFLFAPETAAAVVAAEPIDLAFAAAAHSDATLVATTADFSADRTFAEYTLQADGKWGVQAANVGHGFDADRDRIELFDRAKFTSDDEGGKHSTEHTTDDAANTPAGAQQSIKPQPVLHTETVVVPNQTAMLDSPGTSGSGAVTAPSYAIHNTEHSTEHNTEPNTDVAAPDAADNPHAADNKAEPHFHKHGGGLQFNSTWNNEDHQGLIPREGSMNAADGDAHGRIHDSFHFESSPMEQVRSVAAATLGLGDSFHFKGGISDFNPAAARVDHHDHPTGPGASVAALAAEVSAQPPTDDVTHHTMSHVITHVSHDLMV